MLGGLKSVYEMNTQQSIFDKLEVFGKVVKQCVDCLVKLPNQN